MSEESENNDKRCIAHQIIFDLFNAKELGQIQLLYMACTLSYKGLDPDGLLKAAQNTVDTIKPPDRELLEALKLAMSWISNWSPSFTDDPEWAIDNATIQAAIAKAEVITKKP